MNEIKISGATLNNLKDITVSIPKNKLVVATGVSGSGKSTLMFDIVFEEGRKQYLQALGILSEMDSKQKFQSLSGLAPSIAVQQNIIRQNNPRSTVGSRSNIINLLGILYSSDGNIKCTTCNTYVDDDLVCGHCGEKEEHLQSIYFSPNSPEGMCLKCSGRGTYFEINMDKLIDHDNTTLSDVFNKVGVTPGYWRLLERRYKDELPIAFNNLSDELKYEVINGHYENGRLSFSLKKIYEGRYKRDGEDITGIYKKVICSSCNGFRIGYEARNVFIKDKHIGQLGMMTISSLEQFTQSLDTGTLSSLGKKVLEDINTKINSLVKSRLGHLSLYREMPTLSGGELQRLFLNTHLDSKMDSLIYILDEPTVGLHEAEKAYLIESILQLKQLGNTVIVVEHDNTLIQKADYIIDIGPKAGINGGKVVYAGDLDGLLNCKNSITGQYISEKIKMPTRILSEIKNNTPMITINNVNTNNLKDVSISLPLGGLVGIAGMSGSGKSSLISSTLISLLKNYWNDKNNFYIKNKIEGLSNLSGFAEISQAPIGRNSNSNPATYIGIWDKIRKLFASEQSSIDKEMTVGDFSFNSKGACNKCSGTGKEKIWLGGDLNIEKTCNVCDGKRFNQSSLSIKHKGKNIYDILEMSVEDAVSFFKDDKTITNTLEVMTRIGMGYIKLGQPTPTLSGGEAQRIKLAKEIGRMRRGNILYILDEPTTGLSLYDTAKLINLLDELVANGNSVFVIEHDISLLKICDWIVELGPEGGEKGGYIIAEGSPEQLKLNKNSITGRYL